jgi:hypothetical protein
MVERYIGQCIACGKKCPKTQYYCDVCMQKWRPDLWLKGEQTRLNGALKK